MTSFQCRHHN